MTSATKKPPPLLASPLHLTIRFSNSLPDLQLDIPSPSTTTILSLKYTLRTRLSTRNRLRLIYQGRLLPEASALSSVLKPLAPPSRANHKDDKEDNHDPSGKGKGVAGAKDIQRIYVNCSIGDELTEEELAAEQKAAEAPPETTSTAEGSGAAPTPSTRPRQRGFDRLLNSGLTSVEIATLRTQFQTIQSTRYPPDAPPSPDTLRSLEDDWIDSNAGDNPGLLPGGGGEQDPTGLAHNVDIIVRAMVVGFFFPLGSLTWLLRQDGLWSDSGKWKVFVLTGILFSVLTIGNFSL